MPSKKNHSFRVHIFNLPLAAHTTLCRVAEPIKKWSAVVQSSPNQLQCLRDAAFKPVSNSVRSWYLANFFGQVLEDVKRYFIIKNILKNFSCFNSFLKTILQVVAKKPSIHPTKNRNPNYFDGKWYVKYFSLFFSMHCRLH